MKLLHHQQQPQTQRYNTQSKKKKFTRISRISTHIVAQHKSDSRSSSLHSLVQSTTFLSKPVWKFNKMIATSTTANSNQFTTNSNKPFNSFNKNRRNDFNSCKKIIPNKNLHRQISTQRKSQPIQINRNNFQQQYFNNQSSVTQSFGINAAFSLANMFQNSELTVNLTNNEPRLVIFNDNNNSCNSSNSNQMTSFNSSLPNNNYRESNKFFTPHNNNNNSNKLFHHQKQQFNRNHQQLNVATQDSIATNCNFNTNHSLNSDSYNKNKNLVTNTSFKHPNQRYSNRFKYVKSPVSSNTKNSAPYNTTQYIMFDYSRRRLHDQECPNEQQSFSDEWNMALAANENATNTSIVKNLNDFNLDISTSGLESKRQFSLSEHNLEQMNEDLVLNEEQDNEMQDNNDLLLVQHFSSSL